MHIPVFIGQVEDVLGWRWIDCICDSVEARIAYRSRGKAGVGIEIVGRFIGEVVQSEIESILAEEIEKWRINLEGHAYIETAPEYAGYHAAVCCACSLFFQNRSHLDHIVLGLAEKIYSEQNAARLI